MLQSLRRSARPRPIFARLGEADFNVVLYPEIAVQAANGWSAPSRQPMVKTVPIGVGATRDFIAEVAAIAGVDASAVLSRRGSRLPWYSTSVDSTYLTGKRVVRLWRRDPRDRGRADRRAGAGVHGRRASEPIRANLRAMSASGRKLYDVEALITDDYLDVEARIAELQPELVLGTQMERHIAKRLGIPCAVISAPVHVQDFPARYSPADGL